MKALDTSPGGWLGVVRANVEGDYGTPLIDLLLLPLMNYFYSKVKITRTKK